MAARESEVPFVGGKIGEGLGWVARWGQVGGLWWLGWDGGDDDAPKSPLFVSRFALSVAEMGGRGRRGGGRTSSLMNGLSSRTRHS